MSWPSWDEDFFSASKCELDLNSAIHTLRLMALDPYECAQLRRLWAEHIGSASIHMLSDEAIVQEIARAVAHGRMELPKPFQHKPYIWAPEKVAELEGYFEKLASKGKKALSLINPRWAKPRIPVDTYVEAMFTYSGFEPNQEVTVITYEFDAGGSRTQVGEPMAIKVSAESGDHTFRWKRSADDAKGDLQEDEKAGEKQPLEYRFTVEADEAGFAGFSGPLWLTNTVVVNLKNKHDASAHERPKIVVLKDFEREQRKQTEDGKVSFEEVIVGPVAIWIAEPQFRELRWSKDRVPVGEQVEAIFSYADNVDGTKVTVVIDEVDADGRSGEIARIEGVELKGLQGEAKVPFKRSPDQATADLSEDKRAGEKAPLEYRFYVLTQDAYLSGTSGPLWLTNNIKVHFKNAKGEPVKNTQKVMVLRDFEREIRQWTQDGTATFQDVLVGPVAFRMAEPRFSDLKWSKDQACSGEEVEASFSYEDAIGGMKTTVIVHEVGPGGQLKEVQRIEDVGLGGDHGKAQVRWKVSETKGERAPPAYEFRVLAGDGSVSGASGRLAIGSG